MGCSVLIVEDEWLIAQDATDTLLAAGYEIIGPCGSVSAALAALDAHCVDAAFLDVQLVGEKSFPVAERLHERGIPFCYVSGHEDQDEPGSLRGHRVLVKPAEPRALLAAAERMMRQRGQGLPAATPAQMNGA
jgi:DNA-binding response OmpR family regulator